MVQINAILLINYGHSTIICKTKASTNPYPPLKSELRCSDVTTTNNKTYCERSSKSSRLSGPGRWTLPSERNCLKALGFKPHTCGTTSTNFFCNNWSRLKVNSSSGATQPRLPSKVLNKSANRLVFSAVGPAPASICKRRNFVM